MAIAKDVTETTVDFINWYKNLSSGYKEIAIALMIANLDDDALIRIKTLVPSN